MDFIGNRPLQVIRKCRFYEWYEEEFQLRAIKVINDLRDELKWWKNRGGDGGAVISASLNIGHNCCGLRLNAMETSGDRVIFSKK
ncbi:conserved hypothetical protein [Ricinus communis]|uniref:Uncharacterized protein n=1 Tax=Ricinus communis TaxID=3988 RepID=B9RVD8_RICCO|nr:conserved hypothetical protein [Ricinus communis]